MHRVRTVWKLYGRLVVGAALVVFSAVGVVSGVVPLARKTLAMTGSMKDLSRDIALLETTSSTLSGLDKETLSSTLALLASAVPADKEIGTILGTFDAVTSSLGLDVRDFSLSKPGSLASESAKKLSADESAIGANSVSFSASVTGSPDQIREFLTTVSSVRRLFRLRSMDLSFSGGTVTAKVQMDAFYHPAPKAPGPGGTPVEAISDKEQAAIDKVSSLRLLIPVGGALTAPGIPVSGEKSDPFAP